MIQRLRTYAEFVQRLERDDIFDYNQFRAFRSSTMTQLEWGALVGVAQGTIGNWERGITYPGRGHRRKLLNAAKTMFDFQQRRIDELSEAAGLKVGLNVIGTQNQLNSSILRAAFTDFSFEPSTKRIIPVPFENDVSPQTIESLEKDKKNLLGALAEQATMIVDGIKRGANLETDRFIEYLEKYAQECRKVEANPRLLHRFGSTIAGRTSDDDFRSAISGWDDQAIDGFNSDHIELMRLYFREALARAQEVESSNIEDDGTELDTSRSFYDAADLISNAQHSDGRPIFSSDIPTLLRDIGREVRDLGEAEAFTYDDRRKAVLRRRRKEAIKSGSIYLGRVLFFTSLFVVMSPESLGAVGSVASIMGLMDSLAPGTVRGIYDKIRVIFPVLPRLEIKEKKEKKEKDSQN
jgi:DNA-binding XRE family transcriptional regulator